MALKIAMRCRQVIRLKQSSLRRGAGRLAAAAVLFILAGFVDVLAQSKTSDNSRSPWKFELSDVAGKRHTEAELKRHRGSVFFFIATECPISNRYAPEINHIVAEYSKLNFAFFNVHSDPDTALDAMKKHAQEYGYKFPVLIDPSHRLASRFGVTLTPTAVVVSASGDVLYRGRIDNRYLDFGRYRDAGISSDLRLALDAIRSSLPVSERFTKSIGCAIPPPRVEPSAARSTSSPE